MARLLLLLTAAIVGTTLSVVYRQWMLLLLAVPALIFLFSALFRLHFQNIRKMTFMFNSIENGDYSFKFTEYDAPVSDNLLNLTLNRIKDLLVKAKNEVIDKERYYELILNSVHTGVIVLNETGNVYQINNEARRLIGLPRFTHINQLATIDRSLQELFFAIRGGERKQASYSNERGTVYLAVNASEITIRGKRLRILAVNDINFRGRFHFQVEEDTELLWRYEALPLSDLDPGDRISITFTGPVAESDPAGLSDVVRIQLLDDEK